jgi:hypothetical protein
MVALHGLPFVSGSKLWTQVSFTVTIRDTKASPSASKRANNTEEVALLSVWFSTMKFRGTVLAHTFKYPVYRMM